MELSEKTLRMLRPSEGHVLTQAAEVPDSSRTFSSVVCLGAGDSPQNWREITAEEAEEIKRVLRSQAEARERAAEAERRRRELEEELAALEAGEGVGNG